MMEPYVGIAVFELSKQNPTNQVKDTYFREDFYIVYAENDEDAEKRVEALAHEQEYGAEDSSRPYVSLRHIVDVAPALYGYVDKDCDLYSRHFDSLEDYEKFEMKLGGTDPLRED